MDQSSLAPLIAELFAVIQLLAGYPALTEPPAVQFVPQARLSQMVCGRPCRVRAVYLRDSGIYLDEELDVLGDDLARSILMHELVHHAQAVSGQHDLVVEDCRRRAEAEREAYKLQRLYLRHINSPIGLARFPTSHTC